MPNEIIVAPTLGQGLLATQGTQYGAIDLRRGLSGAASAVQSGVFSATSWKVSEHASGPRMQVQVAADKGLAVIVGNNVPHQGLYVVAPHNAVVTLDAPGSDPTNPRVDRVVLSVRDSTHDASTFFDARVLYLTGTATAGASLTNPVGARAVGPNAILLAEVAVAAGAVAISNTNIEDRRPSAVLPEALAAWTAPTLLNGWVNFGGHEAAGYYLDRKRVFLKGLIRAGAVPSVAFILPVGSRPSAIQLFGVISNGAMGRVDVIDNGDVLVGAPSSNAYVSLAGLSFRVA